MSPRRVGVVVNPVSGAGRGVEMLETLRSCLGPGCHVEATVTGGPGEVPVAARAFADRDLLVVVGGDGTVREVVTGLLAEDGGPSPPLFVVPGGRGNSFYRHLYGRADWRALARRLGRAVESRPVDVGRYDADGDVGHFILGFTGGLFRAAVEASETFGFLPGPLAYLLGMGLALAREPPVEVRLGTDGGTLFEGAVRLVAVGGGRYRGDRFDLLPESRPADGHLHALVVEATGLRDVLAIARAGPSGTHVDRVAGSAGNRYRGGGTATHPAVHYYRAPTFDLSAPRGLPVEVDGTVSPRSVHGAHLSVLPGVLSFAVPTGFRTGCP